MQGSKSMAPKALFLLLLAINILLTTSQPGPPGQHYPQQKQQQHVGGQNRGSYNYEYSYGGKQGAARGGMNGGQGQPPSGGMPPELRKQHEQFMKNAPEGGSYNYEYSYGSQGGEKHQSGHRPGSEMSAQHQVQSGVSGMPQNAGQNGGSYNYEYSYGGKQGAAMGGKRGGQGQLPPGGMPTELRDQHEQFMKNAPKGGSYNYEYSYGSKGGDQHQPGLQPAGSYQYSYQSGTKGAHAPPSGGAYAVHGASAGLPAYGPQLAGSYQSLFGTKGAHVPPSGGAFSVHGASAALPAYGPHPEVYSHTQVVHAPAYMPPQQPYYQARGAGAYHSAIPSFVTSTMYGSGGAQSPVPYRGHPVQYGYNIVPYVYGQHVYHPPPPVMLTQHQVHAAPPLTGIPGYFAKHSGQYNNQQAPPAMAVPGYFSAQYIPQPPTPMGGAPYPGQYDNRQQPPPPMGGQMGHGQPSYQPTPPRGRPPSPSGHYVANPPAAEYAPQKAERIAGNNYYAPAQLAPVNPLLQSPRKCKEKHKGALEAQLHHRGPGHFHNFQAKHKPEGLASTHFYDKHRYVETASQHVCQDQTLRLECPHDEGNRYLHIVGAFFGRGNSHDCPHSRKYMKNTNCRADLSQFKVVHACESKQYCEIPATVDYFSNHFLGDPCPHTNKYLKIFYECRYEKPKECDTKDVPYIDAYACEGQPLNIQCPNEGEVIKILDANYGRQGSDICEYKPGDDLACDSDAKAYEMLCLSCRGKHECEMLASSEIFGDNCAGTNKYLSVRYRCFDPLTEDEQGNSDVRNNKDYERGGGGFRHGGPRGRPRKQRKPGVEEEEEDEEDDLFGGGGGGWGGE
ncbi:uncharacterized protein [Amphiura filiformis]|uniref:uncharacterized protein n=1 Tax=Amphiura filiformis TaxID=82378 RepID=UPI003B21C949